MDAAGLNTKCFVCGRIITEADKNAKVPNGPIKKGGIPGYLHIRCFISLDSQIISNPVSTEDLSGKLTDIIGRE